MRSYNTRLQARALLALLATLIVAGSRPSGAQVPTLTNLHSFVAPKGAFPVGLIQARDGNFYGATGGGGIPPDPGTVFKMTRAGALTSLYTFSPLDASGNNAHGASPSALIQASDGNLYGTTSSGGASGGGTVFKITTAGNLTTLYSFSGNDGSFPASGLVQATDGALYGTTAYGGASAAGTVFKITTAGTLTSLYSFSGQDDGSSPWTALLQASDGNLYGSTWAGAYGGGTFFRITTGGTLTTLYMDPSGVGEMPCALIQGADGSLYGTNAAGIFKLSMDGTPTEVYTFTGGADGASPSAALVQAADGYLYGTTSEGGANGAGTVFRFAKNRTLTTLYSFTGGSDGAGPNSALVLANTGKLYATTNRSSLGTVFSVTTTGVLATLYTFVAGSGAYPNGGLIQGPDGSLYGTTPYGGTNYCGTVFRMTTTGTLAGLHSFTGGSDGANPTSLVRAGDGSLYGTTAYGGGNNSGTIFRITTVGLLTTVYSFTGGSDGANPASLLQAIDGDLYGTTYIGGAGGAGTVFKVTPTGSLTTLYSFAGGSDGGGPGDLIQASAGDLYGTTSGSGDGTVFKLTTTGLLTTLHSFDRKYDGFGPSALIQGGDGSFYGTTQRGPVHIRKGQVTTFDGTVFNITASGTLTTLYVFSGADGQTPNGVTQGSDGNVYGTTLGGGASDDGTVFRITPAGVQAPFYSLSGDLDGPIGLAQASDGTFYGAVEFGGSGGLGAIVRLTGIYPVPVLTSLSPSSTNAGGPGLTVTVKGSAFQPFSQVKWNGSPLTTTYLSLTSLTASVPASSIAAAGKATVSVVTGSGGGESRAATFTVVASRLQLSAAKITRDSASGGYTAALTLKNVGNLSASNVQINKSSLGSAATTSSLPVSLGSIASGATATASLSFPASAGSSGSTVVLKSSGTFAGGTFSGSLKVKLP